MSDERPPMERAEYRVLTARGTPKRWFHGHDRLGDAEELEAILNRQAREGWRVITHIALPGVSRIILERPFQGTEITPADGPDHHSDEIGPAPTSVAFGWTRRRRRRRGGGHG